MSVRFSILYMDRLNDSLLKSYCTQVICFVPKESDIYSKTVRPVIYVSRANTLVGISVIDDISSSEKYIL